VSVNGKVIVVTGSTRGIGLAIAEECARQGATVVISSRSADKVAQVVSAIRANGGTASGFAANVGHAEEVFALRDHALVEHGRIDAWVNNAGVSNGYRPLDEESVEELHDLITINVLGHIYGAKAIVPYFREHGGYLMNLCGRGWKGEATPFTSAYASSKAAIASLTKSIAAENKDAHNMSVKPRRATFASRSMLSERRCPRWEPARWRCSAKSLARRPARSTRCSRRPASRAAGPRWPGGV